MGETLTKQELRNRGKPKNGTPKIKFPWGIAVYICLAIGLMTSWGAELLTGESFIHYCCPQTQCPFFMQASVIMETIKVLGFSTILTGIIYASMDKRIMGLTYWEIIEHKFLSYHICSGAHVVSTILCIISAAAGKSESAVITLAAVLYGFVYQWIAVYKVVLNSSSREKIANSKWTDEMDKDGDKFDLVMRLAGSLPLRESKHYKAHLACLGNVLLKYTEQQIQNKKETREETSSLLQHLVEVLSVLQNTPESRDKQLTVEDLFGEIFRGEEAAEDANRQGAMNAIACSYFVQQLVAPENQDKTEENLLIDVSHRLSVLARTLRHDTTIGNQQAVKKAMDCMFTNYSVFVWVQFQCGNLQLSSELLDLKPDEVVDNCVEGVVNYFIDSKDEQQWKNIKIRIERGLAFLH